MSFIPRWVYPKANTYTDMFNVFTEPKMQSWASCAWDAQIKYVTEACAPKPPLGVGVGKQGQLLLRGAPRGGWKWALWEHIPREQWRGKAWPLGEAAGQEKASLSENMQEQKAKVGAGVQVLGMEFLTICLAPWCFPIPSPGARTGHSQGKRLQSEPATEPKGWQSREIPIAEL